MQVHLCTRAEYTCHREESCLTNLTQSISLHQNGTACKISKAIQVPILKVMIQLHTREQSVKFPEGASDFQNNCGERASILPAGTCWRK